jgi:hypothetical protein
MTKEETKIEIFHTNFLSINVENMDDVKKNSFIISEKNILK